MASTRYVAAYCSLLGAVLLLCSVGCGSGKPMDGDGRLITETGSYTIERLGFRIDVQIVEKSIVYYTVTDRSGKKVLASTERFSDAQRWCLFWDASDCLWVYSSDMGSWLWQRGGDGKYAQNNISTNAEAYARMPKEVFGYMPTGKQDKWRHLRAGGK